MSKAEKAEVVVTVKMVGKEELVDWARNVSAAIAAVDEAAQDAVELLETFQQMVRNFRSRWSRIDWDT